MGNTFENVIKISQCIFKNSLTLFSFIPLYFENILNLQIYTHLNRLALKLKMGVTLDASHMTVAHRKKKD